MSYTFRKGINFAYRLDKYYKKEKLFALLRKISILMTFLVTLVTIIVIFLNIKTSIQTKELTFEKRKILQLFLEHSTETEKIFTLLDKMKFTQKVLNTKDVRFLIYYKAVDDIIKEISKESSHSAIQIKNFSLDKNRKVDFEITTEDLQEYLKLLDSIDKQKFLNLFEELTLTNFNINNEISSNVYTLKFRGKFKPLDKNEK